MADLKQKWLDAIGYPSDTGRYGSAELVSTFACEEFDGEWYRQENGAGRYQRVLLLLPKHLVGKVPAVVVPFYFPEAMLGFDPATGEELPRYRGLEIMRHLVKRGYAVISADAYHLTYRESAKTRDDFSRWQDAADALLRDHPAYSGIGKLVADTRLLIDLLTAGARVDSARIGIAGHSLGGKMAFYTGCLDERISAILASDFGIGWDQTNWEKDWYWGARLSAIRAEGFDHSELLAVGQKPFFLIAGLYDTDESAAIMRRAEGYREGDGRLGFFNHATGHRPTPEALEAGYEFLDRFLKA